MFTWLLISKFSLISKTRSKQLILPFLHLTRFVSVNSSLSSFKESSEILLYNFLIDSSGNLCNSLTSGCRESACKAMAYMYTHTVKVNIKGNQNIKRIINFF